MADSADDPFNLQGLREMQTLVQVKRRRLSVPVRRRPNRLDFVRVHPDPGYRINMPMFKLGKADGAGDEEMYFVRPEMLGEMANEVRMYTVFTVVNLQGNVFMWCVRVPDDDGREPNAWLVANREAAEAAMNKWLRVASDVGAGAYSVFEYEGPLVEPVWPEEPFLELLKLAFKNRMGVSMRPVSSGATKISSASTQPWKVGSLPLPQPVSARAASNASEKRKPLMTRPFRRIAHRGGRA